MRGLSPAGAALRWGAEERGLTAPVQDPLTAASKAVLLSPSGPLAKNQGNHTSSLESASPFSGLPARSNPGLPVTSFKDLRLSLVLSPDPWLRQANPSSCCAHNTAVPTLCLWALAQELQYGDSYHTAQVWLPAPSPVAPISGCPHLLPHVKTE